MASNEKILAFAFTDAENVRLSIEDSKVKKWFTDCGRSFTRTEKVGKDDMHDVEEYLMGTGSDPVSADKAYVSAIMTKLIAGEYSAILLAYNDDKQSLVNRIVPLLKDQKITCYDAGKGCSAV